MPPPPTTVYFFATCLIDAFYPQAGLAAMRLLEKAGVKVVFPRRQSCCGQPAYNAGYITQARQAARHQLKLFTSPYPIVVPSGSCAAMLKIHYPQLFAGTSDETPARRLAGRVYEWSEFLVRILHIRLADRGRPVTVTWHSSCHALREMGVTEDAKALIRQLENVTMKPLKKEAECCGFGGTFAVKQPALSAAMVRDKVDDIVDTGAGIVLAGDCGCLMNIGGALAHRGESVVAMHLAQFLWERTDAKDECI